MLADLSGAWNSSVRQDLLSVLFLGRLYYVGDLRRLSAGEDNLPPPQASELPSTPPHTLAGVISLQKKWSLSLWEIQGRSLKTRTGSLPQKEGHVMWTIAVA